MSSIIIESSPISSAGFCHATNGQSIIFRIVSGITSSTVYCEWFLNGNSVYFGSSYILLIPKTGDSVHARVVNCSGETLRIGNWIEDNMFYYNDVKSGTSTFYIDLKASFNYKILSSVFKSTSVDTVQIKIDDVPIIWSGSGNTINISNTISDNEAIRLNNVSIGQKVTLITNTTNVIRGKIRFIRVMNNYVTPLPTTTTTTTSSTTSTTTTTSNCFQISEQLKYSLYSATDACSQIPVATYYGNNSNFASTTTISANALCTHTAGGWYSNGVIWKFTSDGINFTSSGPCLPPVTTTTTTPIPQYYGYKVSVYVCGSCTLVQSNHIVQDTRSDLILHRYYSDNITGDIFRIDDTNQLLGGPMSNMVGSPSSSCGLMACI